MKKEPKPALHLWVSIVWRDSSEIRLAVFGQTRKEVCNALRTQLSEPFRGQIDERKCQKVTVTEGWGDARRPSSWRVKDGA